MSLSSPSPTALSSSSSSPTALPSTSPETHHKSSFQTSWRKSARRRENTRRPSHRRSGRWQEASTDYDDYFWLHVLQFFSTVFTVFSLYIVFFFIFVFPFALSKSYLHQSIVKKGGFCCQRHFKVAVSTEKDHQPLKAISKRHQRYIKNISNRYQRYIREISIYLNF